jgi:hydrogenase-4 component F
LGVFAALLHLVNHTVAKAVMFLLAGSIEQRYGSTFIRDVRGLIRVMPYTGPLFAFTLLMLIGLPPGGFFISEFALFRAGFSQHPWLMGAALALLAMAFVAFIHRLHRMLFGVAPPSIAAGERGDWRTLPLLLGAAALVLLGLILPAPLDALLSQAVSIVTGP